MFSVYDEERGVGESSLIRCNDPPRKRLEGRWGRGLLSPYVPPTIFMFHNLYGRARRDPCTYDVVVSTHPTF